MTKWYKNPELVKWFLMIAASVLLLAFIYGSPLIPDRYRIPLGLLDCLLYAYANFNLNRVKRREQEKANQVNETRAARRQAERQKNK